MAKLQNQSLALPRPIEWAKSASGLTIILAIAATCLAAVDKGPYVIINIIVIGGM